LCIQYKSFPLRGSSGRSSIGDAKLDEVERITAKRAANAHVRRVRLPANLAGGRRGGLVTGSSRLGRPPQHVEDPELERLLARISARIRRRHDELRTLEDERNALIRQALADGCAHN
jgi:hypothetical protein